MKDVGYKVILFYRFAEIADPVSTAEKYKKLCKEYSLKGRMLVGTEGINATFEGENSNIDKFVAELKKDPFFEKVLIKESAGTGKAFPRLTIKVRDEIVTLGAGKFDVPKETATELPASELQKWYKENKDFVVLDLRNDYEIACGKFERTVDPGLRNFRDLPRKIKNISELKNKKVVTVCTGGIRCEKATCLLKREGFTDVYQLKDGIHTYMKEYPGEHFKGTLFVFDNRLVTDVEKIDQKEIIGKCIYCNNSTEDYYSDDSVRPAIKVLCCRDCAKKDNGKKLRACMH